MIVNKGEGRWGEDEMPKGGKTYIGKKRLDFRW